VAVFLSGGWLARVTPLGVWEDRSVRGSFDACVKVSRCSFDSLDSDRARILCAVSSFNAFDIEPSRVMVQAVSGVPASRFYRVLGELENSGSVVCEGRGSSAMCRFEACPPARPARSARLARRGVRVSRRGVSRSRISRVEVPAGSERLFRHMTGVERKHLLDMVKRRAPESWDVAALLDYIDPSLSYEENKKILDSLLPPAPISEEELEAREERHRELFRQYIGGVEE